MKKIIRAFFTFLGYRISRISPNDIDKNDAFKMQKYLIGNNKKLTIFDIGAYQGDIALFYNSLFPGSNIFCFEPFTDSFSKLKENTSLFENIITINKGMGEYEGNSQFQSNRFAQTNSILATNKKGNEIWEEGLLDTIETLEIGLTTIDSFVQLHSIDKINILKMDVQGAEYMVLNGAKNSLEQGIVDIIYTEIITLPTYEGQLQFDETIGLIKSFGFELFNLYNHSLTDAGQLRQVDAIFVKSNILLS